MKTIVIIKGNNGEQYAEDYQDYIESVWSVNRKNFDFEKHYNEFLITELSAAGFIVYTRNFSNDIDYSNIKGKNNLRKLRQIQERFSPEYYLKNELKATKFDFKEYMV